MRGIVNELYLDDLREKTLRGQKGQKARGFMVGEATYGYRSVPVGEMRLDRRGRPRPDGYRMVIEPSEAPIVQRIFREFGEGKAIKSIVKWLNADVLPIRDHPPGPRSPRGPGRWFELVTMVDAIATNSNRCRAAFRVSSPRHTPAFSLPSYRRKGFTTQSVRNVHLRDRAGSPRNR